MSRVSYFQRFSQRENHATNNTLLIFRHLYQASPLKLQRVLTSLVDTELSIGLAFEQQIQGNQSVPDALISQDSLRIFIETKRGDALDEGQIRRHVESIVTRSQGQEHNILLGLTREPLIVGQIDALRDMAMQQGVVFAAVTFSQVVDALRSQCAEFESELLGIIEDYEQFLTEEKLLEGRGKRLVIFPCGDSFKDNQRFGLYYEPPHRSCRSNNLFIGVYTNKRVILVGKIETIAVCDYRNGIVIGKEELGTLTEEQRKRITDAIEAISYHDLKVIPHRFYLANSFAETDIEKVSPGGMRSPQYLDLTEIAQGEFDQRTNYSSQDIARLLKGKKFR